MNRWYIAWFLVQVFLAFLLGAILHSAVYYWMNGIETTDGRAIVFGILFAVVRILLQVLRSVRNAK